MGASCREGTTSQSKPFRQRLRCQKKRSSLPKGTASRPAWAAHWPPSPALLLLSAPLSGLDCVTWLLKPEENANERALHRGQRQDAAGLPLLLVSIHWRQF